MLTGDKLETATCTAKNAHLITRSQDIHIFRQVSARQETFMCVWALALWPGPFSYWSSIPVPPQLHTSPPNSESIQTKVKENKQPFTQTDRRNQLDHSLREHAKTSCPNLFSRFQTLKLLWYSPSGLASETMPGQKKRRPYRKATSCVQVWLLEEKNNGWHSLKTSVPLGGECWLGLQHIHLD